MAGAGWGAVVAPLPALHRQRSARQPALAASVAEGRDLPRALPQANKLPRNKAGNNKKNKQRRKEERQRRADKRQE